MHGIHDPSKPPVLAVQPLIRVVRQVPIDDLLQLRWHNNRDEVKPVVPQQQPEHRVAEHSEEQCDHACDDDEPSDGVGDDVAWEVSCFFDFELVELEVPEDAFSCFEDSSFVIEDEVEGDDDEEDAGEGEADEESELSAGGEGENWNS